MNKNIFSNKIKIPNNLKNTLSEKIGPLDYNIKI